MDKDLIDSELNLADEFLHDAQLLLNENLYDRQNQDCIILFFMQYERFYTAKDFIQKHTKAQYPNLVKRFWETT